MMMWLLILLFITSLSVLIWNRNWKVFLLALMPLIYVIVDIYFVCQLSGYRSEACVWGYLSYLYALIIGGCFYLTVTLFQVVIARAQKNKAAKSTEE